MKRQRSIFIAYALCIGLFQIQNLRANPAAPEQEHPIRGVLIFLDDSENGVIGGISSDLIAAIYQEAGPIIASASVLVNIRGDNVPPEFQDPKSLVEAYNKLEAAILKATSASEISAAKRAQIDFENNVNAILGMGAFNANTANNWIIKEIIPELYLLLPKKYLQKEGLDIAEVSNYMPQGGITPMEQKLGLKVNHMPTAQVNDIKKPIVVFDTADYFVGALGNTFVTAKEYSASSNNFIPFWGIYIKGHGSLNHTIVRLKLDDFKGFLNFLETKILTRILTYSSCYAAGVNAEYIYKDTERGVIKTYSFPIITMALLDAITAGPAPMFTVRQGTPVLVRLLNFASFFEKMTQPFLQDYHDLIATIDPSKYLLKNYLIPSTPQIKLPGLPWFSVLDSGNKTVAIGSILAKARTEPLDINSFFKKQGKKGEPLALLLYTHVVPFELIISTTEMPKIVSMIPGKTFHQIEKISSSKHSAQDIIKSFDLAIGYTGPDKLFFIDTISSNSDAYSSIIINTNGKVFKSYFYKDGQPYKFPFIKLSLDEMKQFHELILKRDIVLSKPTNEPIRELQSRTVEAFENSMAVAEAIEKIKQTLTSMPNNSAVAIRKISLTGCASELCVSDPIMADTLRDYESFNENKIFYVGQIEACVEPHRCAVTYNVIYKVSPEGMKIFFRGGSTGNAALSKTGMEFLPEDYAPLFAKDLKYFAEHQTLSKDDEEKLEGVEKRSVQKLLTPEALKNLRETIQTQAEKGALRKTKAPAIAPQKLAMPIVAPQQPQASAPVAPAKLPVSQPQIPAPIVPTPKTEAPKPLPPAQPVLQPVQPALQKQLILDRLTEFKEVVIQNRLRRLAGEVEKVISMLKKEPYTKAVLLRALELRKQMTRTRNIQYKGQTVQFAFLLDPIVDAINQDIKQLDAQQ